MMAELISMTYEQARAEHFKALKDEAKRKMNYWAVRVRRCRPSDLNDPAHIKASEYGAEYSYYNDALEALEAAKDINVPTAQPKWISVEERLPELDVQGGTYDVTEEVLAIDQYEEYYVGRFYIYKYQGDAVFISDGNRTEVTHWMPLPEPPKEG